MPSTVIFLSLGTRGYVSLDPPSRRYSSSLSLFVPSVIQPLSVFHAGDTFQDAWNWVPSLPYLEGSGAAAFMQIHFLGRKKGAKWRQKGGFRPKLGTNGGKYFPHSRAGKPNGRWDHVDYIRGWEEARNGARRKYFPLYFLCSMVQSGNPSCIDWKGTLGEEWDA